MSPSVKARGLSTTSQAVVPSSNIGASLGPGSGLAMEDMERRLIAHIGAANRDRRSELDRFRKELMGTLDMLVHPGPRIVDSDPGSGSISAFGSSGSPSNPYTMPSAPTRSTASSGLTSTVLSYTSALAQKKEEKSSQANVTPRKLEGHDLKAEAPIAGRMDEARLAQVLRGAMEDVLSARKGVINPAEIVSIGRRGNANEAHGNSGCAASDERCHNREIRG